jgi:ubiquinone/menaquinone biosynthesis C-methylase UbiE
MNDLAGKAWAEVADLLDLQLSPLGLRAIEALSPHIGQAVLDVGCGAGQSALQLADRVGPAGRVTGVDIAPPLWRSHVAARWGAAKWTSLNAMR